MPVEIFPDGTNWGPFITKPPAQGGKHVIIKITDVTVDQVRTFLQNRWGINLLDPEMNILDPKLPVRRRILELAVDLLPLAVRQQLNQTGTFSTTWPQIRTFVRKITTGETFA